MPDAPFRITPPQGCGGALIAHVPHASTFLPPRERHDIVLGDADLVRELVRLTDWHADELFSWVPDLGGSMFVNRLSRLVFDPERFVDDADEPMAAVGQGVVYTKTTDGRAMAAVSREERSRRVSVLYEPYHAALTALVASTLEHLGTATLLDCHSFATVPLRSEPSQVRPRPDICIGTDPFHTPPGLTEALVSEFEAHGWTVGLDVPFAGTLVPLRYWGIDPRVTSVMIEVRRGLYCDESTGERGTDFEAVRASLQRAVTAAL